jgi:hypothetical protein
MRYLARLFPSQRTKDVEVFTFSLGVRFFKDRWGKKAAPEHWPGAVLLGMTEDVKKSLEKYIDRRRVARQLEIQRHIQEMLSEARSRESVFRIADADQRSKAFLDSILRNR